MEWTKSSTDKTAENILAFVSFIVAIIGVFWSAFVLVRLWGWFISPLFSLPVITMAQAIGLSIVVNFLRGTSASKKIDDKDRVEYLLRAIFVTLLHPFTALVMGWLFWKLLF